MQRTRAAEHIALNFAEISPKFIAIFSLCLLYRGSYRHHVLATAEWCEEDIQIKRILPPWITLTVELYVVFS